MQEYSLGHLANHVLIRDLHSLVAQDRASTAILLAHIAEVDRRRLYAEAGYSSMFEYGIKVLDFSEDVAGKRITAARVARRFPHVFEAVRDGRLHVSGLCVLSKPLKGLRREPAIELLACAEHKTREEIREMLAERFPQPDLVSSVRARPEPPTNCVLSSHAPGRVEVPKTSGAPGESAKEEGRGVASSVSRDAGTESAAIVIDQPPSGRTTPLSPGRFGLQLTMSAETRGKLGRAQELLGQTVARGDLAEVFDRALDALIEKLERRRFGATNATRQVRPAKNARHIPAGVRRAVRARDGERCTFSSDAGRRCEERAGLEFDHIIPVARGGESTVANLRLRCHAHNQLEAERAFGAAFMQAKREQGPRVH